MEKKFQFKKPTKRQIKHFILYSLIIVLGNAIAAAGAAFFIIPNNFVMGGTTGVGILVRNMLPESLSWREWAVTITVYTANIILFIIGAICLGKKFAASTLAGTVLYPAFMSIFTPLNAAYENAHGGQCIAYNDPLLGAIIGSLVFGIGISIVIRVGSSTGGTDIPPLILHKFFNVPVSVSLWVIDIVIVFLQLIAAPVDTILYGVVITLLSSFVIGKVSVIGQKRTQVKIISKKYREIRDMIMKKIDRGVTVLYGQTGYLKEKCYMLLTIISDRELVKLRTEVQKIDPAAFMTMSTVSEVRGRGFSSEAPPDEENLREVTDEEIEAANTHSANMMDAEGESL